MAFVLTWASHTFFSFVFPHKSSRFLLFSCHQTQTRRRTGQQLEQKTKVFHVLHQSPGYTISESRHRLVKPFSYVWSMKPVSGEKWNHMSVHPVNCWTDQIHGHCSCLERASSLKGLKAALIGLFRSVTYNSLFAVYQWIKCSSVKYPSFYRHVRML